MVLLKFQYFYSVNLIFETLLNSKKSKTNDNIYTSRNPNKCKCSWIIELTGLLAISENTPFCSNPAAGFHGI